MRYIIKILSYIFIGLISLAIGIIISISLCQIVECICGLQYVWLWQKTKFVIIIVLTFIISFLIEVLGGVLVDTLIGNSKGVRGE